VEKATTERIVEILMESDDPVLTADIVDILGHKHEAGIGKVLRKLQRDCIILRENGAWRVNPERYDIEKAIQCARFLTGFYYHHKQIQESQYMHCERKRFEGWLAALRASESGG
jgi:predicted Zn-ribbon and HTH transcriptional regulator